MNQLQPYPVPPATLRQDRGRFCRFLGRVYLRLSGWRVEGSFPEVTRYVAIVAPHTSNWDFPLGVALMFAVDLRVSWLGKHSLFKPPFRRLFQWLGGIPVDRRASHGVVGACVKAFETTPHLLLGLAPEGTRKGASQWKSGFYLIATGAQVPILPVAFDFKEHVVRLMPLFQPGGSLEDDLPKIQSLFREVQGLRARPEA